mmetsp:Transcript_6768/g.17721  ORF Transcript_6768/g.17721 Transcript_6768/m.17721 type:complete len:225 (+) Transcript_6768:539-1213(+)
MALCSCETRSLETSFVISMPETRRVWIGMARGGGIAAAADIVFSPIEASDEPAAGAEPATLLPGGADRSAPGLHPGLAAGFAGFSGVAGLALSASETLPAVASTGCEVGLVGLVGLRGSVPEAPECLARLVSCCVCCCCAKSGTVTSHWSPENIGICEAEVIDANSSAIPPKRTTIPASFAAVSICTYHPCNTSRFIGLRSAAGLQLKMYSCPFFGGSTHTCTC